MENAYRMLMLKTILFIARIIAMKYGTTNHLESLLKIQEQADTLIYKMEEEN